jgi:ubiquinone/menaquinone biosynthesis C-methylase UbiE
MSVKFTSQAISQKYDRFARWYDVVEGIPDFLGVRKLRQRLLRRASGKVLEVAVGTGKNLLFYQHSCRIVGADISIEMLKLGAQRSKELSRDVSFVRMDAENLAFPDNSFDTVISSLSTCTFPNPVAALREMARVCSPGGRILLLEHGRSDREWLGRWQDRRADRHAKQFGCHWNRESLNLVREAGLRVNQAQRVFFGIFHQIEAEPPI